MSDRPPGKSNQSCVPAFIPSKPLPDRLLCIVAGPIFPPLPDKGKQLELGSLT